MFKKILIANRGEIAVRVIRACRELGIKTAAVYSEADRTSLHIRLADEAYSIGPAQSSQSYLDKEKIILLAKEIEADAIHPGYGFLSENPEFIKMLEDEKITFIGPSSKSAAMMGNKIAARNLMRENGIPIVPGTLKPVSSEKEGKKSAEEIGYPVILKAGGGGGGKGMKKVFSEKDFLPAFESASREALSAFGNPEIYIEKFFVSPKHIEVQVIADKHGNYAHLFERECSAQRRYQKIIEEAPSSSVDGKTRTKITEAAVFAAKACLYYNAGTIEFLMDKDKKFYFLEMNTRIQVEHPVTEMITGIDLVKEQISIAAGNRLSFAQDDLKINGHAIECRICAEDFLNNFLPSAGEIYYYREPSGKDIRVDSGFNLHSIISINYDSLIAKQICHAPDRGNAIKKTAAALSEFLVAGVITNIPFLVSILNHNLFTSGSYDINFIEKHISELNEQAAADSGENLDEVAALFAAVMKSGSVPKNKIKTPKNNRWSDLIYE
ncbi:MAG TPA: acetyl-CoA carboxylase biotin carboxylase subunit [Ignavibacteriaceae bacterium]|nr:acetyl-CoA carboxylase biotin carboxylase subunit [Ignavibacteriaceae bacterium]